jgi:hypothetical protein
LVHPGVQLNAVKCDPLRTNPELRDRRPDFPVKPVPIHAEVERRISEPDEPWQDGCAAVCQRLLLARGRRERDHGTLSRAPGHGYQLRCLEYRQGPSQRVPVDAKRG